MPISAQYDPAFQANTPVSGGVQTNACMAFSVSANIAAGGQSNCNSSPLTGCCKLIAVHASISGGAAGSWAMTNLAPRALGDNFAPGFYVKHIIKDMRIALDSAAEMKLDLPGLAGAKKLYEQVAARGWEDCGTQALYRLYTSL